MRLHEGSTRLLHELGAEGYAEALGEHRRALRQRFAEHAGVEVDTQGDAFFYAFARASDACAAASAVQAAFAGGSVSIRIGLHTGEPLLTDEGYVGMDVHKAARICAAGHGGQVLLSQSTRDLVETDARDLGLHRLKDLSAPEHLFQLDEHEHPPLKTLHQANLPVVASPLVGRDGELAALLELTRRPHVRLVTLTGVGGTGKTRLALQVAAESIEDFPGGVWFVGLASISDPELVLPSVAQALGARGELAAHIGNRRLLLLLDNLEQVSSAGTDLAALLASCPELHLMVTSREPLHVSGEHEYPVPPLAPSEAESLFRERALAVDPAFVADAAVSEICRRLDGLPLAIELAATRVKLLSTSALLDRLERALPLLTGGARDAPERQRTLRATIDWSHGMLSPEEQRLLHRLGVFRGGFSLEAVEGVCEADLESLGSLVDKSLVRRRTGTDRYFLFETIREFALEHLTESGEADLLSRRHAEHFLTYAEALGARNLYAGDQAQRIAALAQEEANFRVAIEWAVGGEQVGVVCRFGVALWAFWLVRGHALEARGWLEEAVERIAPDAEERLGALVALSEVARFQGSSERAQLLKEEAVRVAADRGETWYQAAMLADLGDLEMDKGDFDKARELLNSSLRLRSEDAPRRIGRILASCATLALLENDLERADELFSDALDHLSDADAGGVHVGGTLASWAELARRRGDHQRAESLFGRALRILHALGDGAGVADCLEGLAALEEMAGRAERAGRLVGAARALRESSGLVGGWPERVPQDTPAEAQRTGESMDLDEAVAYALPSVD